MKKILLTTAAVAAISTSAFADMMENQFYLRGDLDALIFSKFKTTTSIAGSPSVKIKPKFGLGFDIGAGYYVMDNVRAELIYTQPFAPKMKSTALSDAAPNLTPTGVITPATTSWSTNSVVKHKPTIRALFARVHGDVIDLGMGKIFLTGGLGWSQVKNSITTSYTDNTIATAAAGTTNAVVTQTNSSTLWKAKNKNNIAWTIGAGAAFDVAEGVHLDVAYSYRAFGKAKAATTDGTKVTLGGPSFNSHNVSAGVRFDI